jgi:hypothetical protein
MPYPSQIKAFIDVEVEFGRLKQELEASLGNKK